MLDSRNLYQPRVLSFILSVVFLIGAAYCTYAEWRGFIQLHLYHYDYAFFYYAFHAVAQHQPGFMLYHVPSEQSFLSSLGYPLRPYNQYVYPPQFAVMFAFLGRLPFQLSADLWMAVSTLFFILGLWCLVKLIWPGLSWKGMLLIVIAGLSLMPVQVDLGAGNINSVLFGLIMLTNYWLHHSRQPWLAGIPLGLAIAFKVTPVAILVYFVFRRNWKTALSAVFTVTFLSLWSQATLGGKVLGFYVRHFMSFGQTSMKNGPAPYNQSLLGVLQDFQSHHVLGLSATAESLVYLASAVLVALVFLHVFRKTPANLPVDLALSNLSLLLFSPLVEEMHMIFAIPAWLVLVRSSWKGNSEHSKIFLLLVRLVAFVVFVIMSLPMTFALNYVTHRWPQWFWLHTQMFWALLMAFVMILWLAFRKPARTYSEAGFDLMRY